MGRVYGYKRRAGFGKRYQDGIGATSRTDAVKVIDTAPVITSTELTKSEELEIEIPCKPVPVAAPEPAPVAVDEPSATDTKEEEAAPEFMSGFMAVDNLQAAVSNSDDDTADSE